jgi:hypothetical protein
MGDLHIRPTFYITPFRVQLVTKVNGVVDQDSIPGNGRNLFLLLNAPGLDHKPPLWIRSLLLKR